MTRNISVPIANARGIGQLPELLEERAGPRALRRAFHSAGVPFEIIENRDVHMPVSAMISLFESAARHAGDRGFGLSVGEAMSHSAFGLWIKYCGEAPTLGQGIVRSVATSRFQQTGGYLSFHHQGDHGLWRYNAPPLNLPRAQHSDHLLYPMISFVRSFLGACWKPAWIELDYPRSPDFAAIEARLPAEARFDQACLGLEIPVGDLLASNATQLARPLTLFDVELDDGLPGGEPLRSLFAVANMRLIEGLTDIDGLAQTVGVGVQSLQRRLRSEGVTYRDLLGLVRSARARAMLRETKLSVTEIAFALGYFDHANFTRAFNRWVGCTPSEYRAGFFKQEVLA